MSVLDTFRSIINKNATFKNRQALDDNKKQANALLDLKRVFLNRLEVMKTAKVKSDTSRTTFEGLDAFETYMLLKDGIFVGVKNVEDGRYFFEFAFPKNKTKKTYNYYFVSEFDNNSPRFPNFDIFHIVEEDKRSLFAKTNVRTAVITAPMQLSTQIVSPATDKSLGIDIDTLNKSLPVSDIRNLLFEDPNLIQKAITDRQWYQIHKLQQGL